MEKTNFYDAIYSPVILILNAIVVAVVMLLSATGNHQVLKLFGMSAGTAVALMNAGAFLNFPDFYTGGKPWYGDSDDSVSSSGNS